MKATAVLSAVACLVSTSLVAQAQNVAFQRGDANASGRLEITDPVLTLGYLFLGTKAPVCLDAADADDSGVLNIGDPVGVLNFLFLGGLPPHPPFGACGLDPSPDGLSCASFPPCAGAPTASFTFSQSPPSGEAPSRVDFDASSSSGEIESFEWTFGDGDSGSGVLVTHTYTRPGRYSVTLTARAGELSGVTQDTVTVRNRPPTAVLSAEPLSGEAPLTVRLDASGSFDLDGSIIAFRWDLGDGEEATGVTLEHTYSQEGRYSLRLTVEDDGRLTDTATATIDAVCARPGALRLDPHPSLTASPSVLLSGTAPGAAQVEIAGPAGLTEAAVTGGRFDHELALLPGGANRMNTIVLTAVSACGARSSALATTITHDQEPPNLFIDLPADGAAIQGDRVDVAGRVGDRLAGFMGLSVTVNGQQAAVDEGIGTNGTFFLAGLELAPDGPTTITVVATDVLGNQATRTVTVSRAPPPGPSRIVYEDGNAQSAEIASFLPEPIVVRVWRSDGVPFAGKLVEFRVTRSDGRLSAEASGSGDLVYQARTAKDGRAQAFWRLGTDAGCGNNRVVATSAGIEGEVVFCASATPAPANRILIGSGNNQQLEAAALAPEPLRVWASDGCNGVEGVPVTFRVVQGDGRVEGSSEATVATSRTGHAEVRLEAGATGGVHLVEADFAGNPGAPAVFAVRVLERRLAEPTSFSGVVLDNAGQPIAGATCWLSFPRERLNTQSDIYGRFEFAGIPHDGRARLDVDGLTATHVGGEEGRDVAPGSFPGLSYEVMIVPNAANTLGRPVLLPPLNPARPYDGTADVELAVEGVEGLRMLVKAGSMTRRDGTRPSPGDPEMLSLSAVHHDDVPMPMPDGASPPFAWTLQPAGATFDPPIEVTYPNMSGLPAGAVAYFLSFDHDTSRFEIVATGHVSEDGAEIVTDPGSGLDKSGWGCNCPPYSVTGSCRKCEAGRMGVGRRSSPEP